MTATTRLGHPLRSVEDAEDLALRFGAFSADVRAALFGLDRTVMSGSALYPLARAVADAGISERVSEVAAFPRATLVAELDAALRYAAPRVSDSIVRTALRGCSDLVFTEMRGLVSAYESTGIPTYLFADAPFALVAGVARSLGMSGGAVTPNIDLIGRAVFDTRGGRRVGLGSASTRLGAAIAGLAARGFVDLGRSCAYASAIADIDLLVRVRHAFVVNADDRLSDAAENADWPRLEIPTERASDVDA